MRLWYFFRGKTFLREPKLWKSFKNKNLKSKLVLQVHDELIIDAFKDELDEVKNILKVEMENAANLSVPLTADMNVGETWYDAK